MKGIELNLLALHRKKIFFFILDDKGEHNSSDKKRHKFFRLSFGIFGCFFFLQRQFFPSLFNLFLRLRLKVFQSWRGPKTNNTVPRGHFPDCVRASRNFPNRQKCKKRKEKKFQPGDPPPVLSMKFSDVPLGNLREKKTIIIYFIFETRVRHYK